MFSLGSSEWSRTLLVGIGALLLSAPLVGRDAAPAAAAQACLLVSTSDAGDQLVCSHA
jgi:hypothetical protein